MHPDPAERRSALSHIAGSEGQTHAVMVDVSAKLPSARRACARAVIAFPAGLLERVLLEGGPKGPVTEVARVAGIQAAKRTSEWIPMCHTLPLEHVEIEFARLTPDTLEVRCTAACTGKTGVEMEAMVGASAAALVVYDMTKALSHEIALARVELLEKSGGKSGTWRRAP
ncbi:MAG: cyclic pyranopterin monophosphate synthase MoaC [Planctomycetes bacterium]|nr:cyclic pyranopterin monophosphate synthase MoaC [Planctomycetota bacterium]